MITFFNISGAMIDVDAPVTPPVTRMLDEIETPGAGHAAVGLGQSFVNCCSADPGAQRRHAVLHGR